MTLSYQPYITEKTVHDADIILSYHNTCIRKSDLNLLLTSSSDRWLNDIIISFAFEYFEYDLFKNYANSIAFLDPSVAHILKLSQETNLEFFLQPLDLKNKDLILIPINDHASSHDSGGTHWSLAVFYNPPNHHFNKIEVYHYDSNHFSHGVSNNFNHALKLAQNLVPCLISNDFKSFDIKDSLSIPSDKKNGLASFSPGQIAKNIKNGIIRSSPRLNKSFINFTASHSSNTLTKDSNVKNAPALNVNPHFCIKEVSYCPQQRNGYDCGVYCIAFAEIIALAYINHITKHNVPCLNGFPKKIDNMTYNTCNQKNPNAMITRNKAKTCKQEPRVLIARLNSNITPVNIENDDFHEDLSPYLDKECLSSSNSSTSSSPNNNSNLISIYNGNCATTDLMKNHKPLEQFDEFILPFTEPFPPNTSEDKPEIEPAILDSELMKHPIPSSGYSTAITPEYISNKRKELYDIIIKLSAKKDIK